LTTWTYLYDGDQLTFSELIRALPDKEFASPSRSTLPLLAWWRNRSLPAEIYGDDNYTIEVEAQVASTTTTNASGKRHKNRPSCTDIMIRGGSAAAAVEGKWTEPAYDTVARWLGPKPTNNKLAVLDHWAELVQPYCGTIDRDLLAGCTYQMLHRTASACAQGRDEVVMVYQLFAVEHRRRYIEELRCLRAVLQPRSRLRLVLMVVPLKTTPAWAMLGRGEPERVRASMLAEELFEFGAPEVHCDQ